MNVSGFRTAWQTEIAVRIGELRHRLDVAQPTPPAPGPPVEETVTLQTAMADLSVQVRETPRQDRLTDQQRAAHVSAAERSLKSAEQSVNDAEREASLRERFRAWWSGTIVTAAWESVHEAEAELVEIEDDNAVRASLARLLRWIKDAMAGGDQTKRYEEQLAAFMDGKKPLDRTVVRQAYRDVISANNEKHVNLRVFRNQLLIVTVVLGVLLAGLAVWHAANPSFISLCGTKSESVKQSSPTGGTEPGKPPATGNPQEAEIVTTTRCLNGSGASKAIDVLVIELVGALGGLLGIAIKLGETEAAPSRYDPRGFQALLKPLAGAATALIGVLLLQGDILISPASDVSESLLLAYAALFGFSQQLFTQFVDKRGAKLLGE